MLIFLYFTQHTTGWGMPCLLVAQGSTVLQTGHIAEIEYGPEEVVLAAPKK